MSDKIIVVSGDDSGPVYFVNRAGVERWMKRLGARQHDSAPGQWYTVDEDGDIDTVYEVEEQPVTPLLNVNRAADALGVTPNTVYQLVWNGDLPCIRLGGKALLFGAGDIENRLAEKRQPAQKTDDGQGESVD